MADRVYKKLELVGTSSTSIEDAVSNAVTTACKTIEHVDWFEVMETRGHVQDGQVAHYQVVIKIGFRVDQ